MKNAHTHSALRKIIFLIESLSSAELLSRTLMELWINGYEAERIPIGQIMTQMSCSSDGSPGACRPPAPEGLPLFSDANRHPLAQTHLIVTDRADIAACCLQHGFAVIGYLHDFDHDQNHDQNKDMSFDGIGYLIEDISGLDAPFCELAFCRAHQLPYTVLETERCLIREITLDDVPRLYEIYAEPAITSYIEALYADEAAERSYIRDYIDHVYSFYGYGMWIVVNKGDGQVIGRAGIEPKEAFAELGYVIAREYQNQGYATEVCRAIVTYAADRLSLPAVFVRVQKENTASLRICEKLHFQSVPHADDSDMLLFTLRLNVTS